MPQRKRVIPDSPPRDQKAKHRASKMVLKNLYETDSDTESSEDESPRPTLFPFFGPKRVNNLETKTETKSEKKEEMGTEEKMLEEALNLISNMLTPNSDKQTKSEKKEEMGTEERMLEKALNVISNMLTPNSDKQPESKSTDSKSSEPKNFPVVKIIGPFPSDDKKCCNNNVEIDSQEFNKMILNAANGRDLAKIFSNDIEAKQVEPQKKQPTNETPALVGKDFVNMIFNALGSDEKNEPRVSYEKFQPNMSNERQSTPIDEKTLMDMVFSNFKG
jgi:hypothetical protein